MKLLRRTIGGVSEVWLSAPLGNLPRSNICWGRIHEILSSEFGLFQLGPLANPYDNVVNYFVAAKDINELLDCLDVCFGAVVNEVARWTPDERRRCGADTDPRDAIEILNQRFSEHGVGYRFQNGQIVRIDNELLNVEIVAPAMNLLSDPVFAGANDEFITALDHHRYGREKEAILGAVQAFESTMKTICSLRGWTYDPKDAAKKLIDVMLKNKLIPMSLQTQFHSLHTVLESGAPALRNGVPGHGQGVMIVNIPEEIAGYAINLVAANIVLLVSANRRFI